MSADLHELVTEIDKTVTEILSGETAKEQSESDIASLLISAVRLYSAITDHQHGQPSPADLLVTPTEACNVAAALLRSQLLTPFEFGIWFSGGMDFPQ